MARRRRHLRELGAPELDVCPVGVVVLGLLEDVEPINAAAAEARRGVPVAPVRLGRVVDEELLEVLRA